MYNQDAILGVASVLDANRQACAATAYVRLRKALGTLVGGCLRFMPHDIVSLALG